jgi:hypothetical protein
MAVKHGSSSKPRRWRFDELRKEEKSIRNTTGPPRKFRDAFAGYVLYLYVSRCSVGLAWPRVVVIGVGVDKNAF